MKPYYRDALLAFGRMSGWVVTPIILALVVGRRLDRAYGTEPTLFVAFIGVGFLVSMLGIYRESRRYIKNVEAKDKARKEELNESAK